MQLHIYRVSHQYGNTFNFNLLILYQRYCKSKTCFEKFRSKPSRGHLDFDFFQKIRLFFRVDKKRNKTEIFFGSIPPPTPFFSKCPKILFSQIHVPGYMNLKKKQNSMYPGTWIWRRNKIPCTRVWENKILGHFEEKGVGAEWSQKKFPFCFVFCRP